MAGALEVGLIMGRDSKVAARRSGFTLKSSYSLRTVFCILQGPIIKTAKLLLTLAALSAFTSAQAHSHLQAMKNSALARFSKADLSLLQG